MGPAHTHTHTHTHTSGYHDLKVNATESGKEGAAALLSRSLAHTCTQRERLFDFPQCNARSYSYPPTSPHYVPCWRIVTSVLRWPVNTFVMSGRSPTHTWRSRGGTKERGGDGRVGRADGQANGSAPASGGQSNDVAGHRGDEMDRASDRLPRPGAFGGGGERATR